MCLGPGHLVVYGNAAFLAAFGAEAIGLPAREGLVSLPRAALTVLDAVIDRGRPLARWISWQGDDWRLTVAPRQDPETHETYGVSIHLRARSDALAKPGNQPGL